MNPKLLINTITSWNEPPRARHQFTFALAKRIPVVFVTRNKTGWPGIKVTFPQNNITLIEPSFPLDHRVRYRLPVINEIYQHWIYKRLRKRLGDLVVVNFDFTGTQLVKYFPRQVYYCNDEFTHSDFNNRLVNAYFARCEKKIASSAGFVVATSVHLRNKLLTYNPSTYEIPLGVDSSYFQEDIPHGTGASSGKIKAGLLGFISERKVCPDAINRILENPQIQLSLIGPVEDSFLRKIKQKEKLHMTGPLKGSELRAELSKMDVGLALYNMKRINQGVTPNKLWRYMAMGKPTVISKLPNLREKVFPEKSVYTLENEHEIIDLILQAHEEDSLALKEVRIAFARQNTWDKRLEQFSGIFKEHFPDYKLD